MDKKDLQEKGNEQSKNNKILISGCTCCIGIILIISLMGMLSPDKHTNTTETNTASGNTSVPPTPPENVTIEQLYGSSIPEGTKVQVTGKVIQSDGSLLRMKNANGKDILVKGFDLRAYEGDQVTVIGIFDGPSSYSTVLGASRTVPRIINAYRKYE